MFVNLLAKYLAEAIVRELTHPVKELVKLLRDRYVQALHR